MKMMLRLIHCLVVTALVHSNLSAAPTGEKGEAKPDVTQLIEQLGNDEYLLRQRAESQLLERGAEVFAELQAAAKNADLEVATRAKYLLTQISIEWVHPNDPPAVRSIMSRYGELSLQLRLRKIRDLANLEDQEGFGALCRIARFDSSSGLVARYAALAVVDNGLLPTARVEAAVAMLREELGEDPDAPVSWIEVYADQLQSPKQIDRRWVTLIDQELALLTDNPGETSDFVTLALLQTFLELGDKLSDQEAILAGLQRRIEFSRGGEESANEGLIDAITWVVDRDQWEALRLLEEGYAPQMKASRRVLYHLALAREKEGLIDQAEEVAREAIALEDDDFYEHNECADLIASRGHHDWAEREWYAVVEAAKPVDIESLLARTSLAMYRLNDRLEHKAAADMLAEAIDAIEANPQVLQYYETQIYAKNKQRLLGYLEQARANRDFFLAAHFASLGEHEREREYLEKAFVREPANPDIIIAMYHSKDADEAHRKKTLARLQSVKSGLEKDINEFKRKVRRSSPELNRYLAHKYNHWAWLISNTEGDFDKAVQYSQQSLEFQPGSPSYLDTLGRCHYSAGNVEAALEAQREAVSQQPHLLVMQRQLQLFEDELQKREAGEAP